MPKKKPKRHPWDKWFKRKRFKLIAGKHYDCMTHSMAQQVRNAAFDRGIEVSITIKPEHPITGVQVIDVETYKEWEDEV